MGNLEKSQGSSEHLQKIIEQIQELKSPDYQKETQKAKQRLDEIKVEFKDLVDSIPEEEKQEIQGLINDVEQLIKNMERRGPDLKSYIEKESVNAEKPDFVNGEWVLEPTPDGNIFDLGKTSIKFGDNSGLSFHFNLIPTPDGYMPDNVIIDGGKIDNSVVNNILLEGWESKVPQDKQKDVIEHAKNIYAYSAAMDGLAKVVEYQKTPGSNFGKYDFLDYKNFLEDKTSNYKEQISQLAEGENIIK